MQNIWNEIKTGKLNTRTAQHIIHYVYIISCLLSSQARTNIFIRICLCEKLSLSIALALATTKYKGKKSTVATSTVERSLFNQRLVITNKSKI